MKEYAGKVLIIVQNLPVPFDRRVWLEARTLNENGLKVSVICPKSQEYSRSFEKIDDISIYRYKIPIEAQGVFGYIFEFFYAWIRTALLSIKVLFKEGFDVIQACNPPDTFFLLGAFYKLFGKIFIFDHHDLCPEMFIAKYEKRNKFLLRILKWLEKRTFRTAKLVLTTNESYKKIAIERGGKNPHDVFVVRTGPDLSRLHLKKPDIQLKNGKKYLVCYLGEMCPQDGVDYLLDSIEHYVYKLGGKDTQFTLIGGGPEMPELRRKSKEMGLYKFVHFTGRIPDEEVCSYLSTADLCVDPDPWSEWSNCSTMNKMLEYMTFGKPIVAYDLEENKKSADRAAVYIRPNDTDEFARNIKRLLHDEFQRREMGEFGFARVHGQLAWEHTHKQLLVAYYRLFPKMITMLQAEETILDVVLQNIQNNAVDTLLKIGEKKVSIDSIKGEDAPVKMPVAENIMSEM